MLKGTPEGTVLMVNVKEWQEALGVTDFTPSPRSSCHSLPDGGSESSSILPFLLHSLLTSRMETP